MIVTAETRSAVRSFGSGLCDSTIIVVATAVFVGQVVATGTWLKGLPQQTSRERYAASLGMARPNFVGRSGSGSGIGNRSFVFAVASVPVTCFVMLTLLFAGSGRYLARIVPSAIDLSDSNRRSRVAGWYARSLYLPSASASTETSPTQHFHRWVTLSGAVGVYVGAAAATTSALGVTGLAAVPIAVIAPFIAAVVCVAHAAAKIRWAAGAAKPLALSVRPMMSVKGWMDASASLAAQLRSERGLIARSGAYAGAAGTVVGTGLGSAAALLCAVRRRSNRILAASSASCGETSS